MGKEISEVTIQVVQGDITRQPDLDIIVNAANTRLMGGGGVDGAIHRAAGPQLKEESGRLGPIHTGQAVLTGAYRLPNRYVIHCVGPVYGRDKPEAKLLADCYRNALKLAEEKHIASIGFPAISTGIYGYPMEEAARVMFTTFMEMITTLHYVELLRVVLFDQEACMLHQKVLTSLFEN
ncbi:MAG TPA: macro domain-containing protein [Syntrophomonadaceae bacterium]|nr:macro domain-containing protein [Syntrophomonadaceae bacterium]